MYALCSDAMLKAVTRQARAVDRKVAEYNATHTPTISIAYFFDHLAVDEDTAVMVTEQDFVGAHKELVPSVSADELRHYQTVRATFEGTGKKEDEGKKAIAAPPPVSNGTGQSAKGKGKARASGIEEEEAVVRTEGGELNGLAGGSGKGKAHGAKNSVDIAEGGFGDAAQDEDLYA
jgi:peroxin-6